MMLELKKEINSSIVPSLLPSSENDLSSMSGSMETLKDEQPSFSSNNGGRGKHFELDDIHSVTSRDFIEILSDSDEEFPDDMRTMIRDLGRHCRPRGSHDEAPIWTSSEPSIAVSFVPTSAREIVWHSQRFSNLLAELGMMNFVNPTAASLLEEKVDDAKGKMEDLADFLDYVVREGKKSAVHKKRRKLRHS